MKNGAWYFLRTGNYQAVQSSNALEKKIFVMQEFPEVYQSILEDDKQKSSTFKISIPQSFNRDFNRRAWVFARRTATIIRNSPGNVNVELSVFGSIFSPILGYSAFVAELDRGEPLLSSLLKFFPWQHRFILSKG